MYAMVEIKGKQYKAEKGNTLKIDKLPQDIGEELEFNNVLMVRGDENIRIGSPYVDGAKIKAIVEEHGRDKKIIVYKYKRRKNYKRKQGHRQAYSVVRVADIIDSD